MCRPRWVGDSMVHTITPGRRHFEVGDAVSAKGYRGAENTWMSAPLYAKRVTRPILCVVENLFGFGISLRPRECTPTLNHLLHVFNLPLFDLEADTTNPAPASPPPEIVLRRPTRICSSPRQLHMDPERKAYRS
ncbi:hypothetical protein Tcan_01839 [Toxocara canis]|uniref:Uncharacterized protein n=1 Tax=Toxocara canis TaxID=6265 RepID=A0A0B2V5E9_TOXCA|nr:hypothetical protein Tcan_01839 [Toxocara canis]